MIPLPATGTLSLDLHHWFETDFEYEVDEVAPGGVSPFWWEPFPNPGKVTNYDGATLWVRPAPGGVPGPTATRLDLTGPQAAEPFWVTFNNAAGYRWELDLNAFRFYPFLETTEWLQTNYVAGVDKGFSGTSYGPSVDDRRNAIPQAQPGGWGVNTAQAEWIDSTFDLTPWAGQEVVLEFRFASKKKQNGACRNPPLVGTTFYPQCLECMQNLEALVDTSPNHRRSRGWRIDRIEVRQD